MVGFALVRRNAFMFSCIFSANVSASMSARLEFKPGMPVGSCTASK